MPDEFGNPLPGEVLEVPAQWTPAQTAAGLQALQTYYNSPALRNALQDIVLYGTIPGNPEWFQQATLPAPLPPEPKISLPMEADVAATKVANTFLVGCDPEMIFIKNGQLLNVRGKLAERGEVGWDHSGDVIELRPEPAKSTYTLTRRLHTLLKKHPKLTQFESAKWRSGAFFEPARPEPRPTLDAGGLGVGMLGAGGRPVPGDWRPMDIEEPVPARNFITLGGHVHLDIKPTDNWLDPHDWYYDRSYVPALDRVTRYFEHLDLLPKSESLKRRQNGDGYGTMGDIRCDHHRMEYRTMASWLYSPRTSFLCLTGAKLAAVDPELTLDTLKLKDMSFKHLTAFYEAFQEKDVDAKRVCEELLSQGHKPLQADPDQDVKGAWG